MTTTEPTAARTSATEPVDSRLPMCEEVGYPTAPKHWYADRPLYVGSEMPIEDVQTFASGLEGYETIWIDWEHNGWVTVGFVDSEVATYQAVLEEEFPGVGLVAVEMPYTFEELDRIRQRIAGALPDDMDASNMHEARGMVIVWVGRLTPERVRVAEAIVGDDPACLEGMDPATTSQPGPQPVGGEGWALLAVVDSMVGDGPASVSNAKALALMSEGLGADGNPPPVDFDTRIVVAFSVLYSGSCPETRFDDVVVEHDLVHPIISHLSTEPVCTADGNPRTYLVAIERDVLPQPPFRISNEKGTALEVRVTADLRLPGRVLSQGDVEVVVAEPPRTATPIPMLIETGFPSSFTIDVSCGIAYLGVINRVGWHIVEEAEALPATWEQATIDGLLDLTLLMTEGPQPTLTASAGGHDILYLPGPDQGDPCG